MSGWKEYRLEEVVDKFIDYRGKTPRKTSTGMPLITAKIVKNGRIEKPDEFISESDYRKWMTRGFPRKHDVLLTTEAPVGQVALLNDDKVALAQRIILLRGKPEILDNIFLNYSLQSKLMQHRLRARSSGSTVQGIKASELKKVEIPIPSLHEQKQIANLLFNLDQKIDLLCQQNETLEQIAQTLFKRWFVEFEFPYAFARGRPDPPGEITDLAKVDISHDSLISRGQPYKSSGGKMVPSELGEIPEGWRVGKLGEVVINFDSRRIPLSKNEREKRKGIYPYYGAASIVDYIDDYLFEGIYLLMAEDGTVIDGKGFPILQYVFGKFWVNNHTHVLKGKRPFFTEFIYLLLTRTRINSAITGAVQPKINQENMNSIEIVVPNIENINFEHLTFLTTYIIPLICFDLSNVRYAVVLFFLLAIIGAIYVKTDMFYANPSLALLGYHIYKVNGKFMNDVEKQNIVLIAREHLNKNDRVAYQKLDERIYYVRVRE